jgi:hypothetical protein
MAQGDQIGFRVNFGRAKALMAQHLTDLGQ